MTGSEPAPAPATPDRAAFYVTAPDGTFASTEHTAGPWDAALQHGGPPAALLGREIARVADDPGLSFARFTFELLGPVPVAELAVVAEVARAGRRVQMIEGTISGGGRVAMRARAWQVAASRAPTVPPAAGPPPSRPQRPSDVPPPWNANGYLRAIEWRFTSGGFDVGPAAAWTRPRVDLVAGEPLDPLSRVLLVADSGNGLSAMLDLEQWYFINPELTVHLLRPPRGEWLHLAAETAVEHGGSGLARSTLSDEVGPLAYSAQSLLVAER